MLDALRRSMPEGTTWTVPAGGFYVWVTLPEGLDATAMLPRAVTARVAYVPGTAFYADGHGVTPACGCRTATRPRSGSREGVRRLAGVLEGELELLDDVRQPARLRRVGPSRRPRTCA